MKWMSIINLAVVSMRFIMNTENLIFFSMMACDWNMTRFYVPRVNQKSSEIFQDFILRIYIFWETYKIMKN